MIEEELFNKAVALRGEERSAFLDQACAGDPALRAAVEALLRADEEASGYLEPRSPGLERTEETAPLSEQAGTIIAGRYKLLEPIGEGGMGTVWLAEQIEPVKRKVALKLIKPGMDSKSVLARFEAERQALALMDHPNIAKVLDGGATGRGRPYFVMELVKGLPLTEYSDSRRLGVRDRLELFVPICQAVQHAHQKGIIHRDLKPSNILVTEHDGRPIPKVIDFGLAKALGAAATLTERTLHTAFGTVVGTPLYMAPEQVAVNALDVDTRSDVYSLGVILYELLTGTTPLDKQRFKEAAWEEIRRVIREEEPPRPSMRLSDSHDSLPSISAQRHTEPATLTKLVRGELDWIVMKALEKDRNRRYETAAGFSMDVQRYLAGEVVQACPPSAVYRFKKFVRRNKASVLAASLILFALVAGVVGTTIGLVQARTARAAEAQRAEGEREAKVLAEANFALAGESVEKYLSLVSEDPDLRESGLYHLRKKLLESAIPFFQSMTEQKGDNPKVQLARGMAYLRLALARRHFDDHQTALQDSEAARAIFERLLAAGNNSVDDRAGLARAHYGRAMSLQKLGKLRDAETDLRQAISILENLVAESPREVLQRELVPCYHTLGTYLIALGEPREAVSAFQQSLAAVEKVASDAEILERQAVAYGSLGQVFGQLGEFDRAEKSLRAAIDIGRKYAAEHPKGRQQFLLQNDPYQSLCFLLIMQNKLEEAEATMRRSLERHETMARQDPTSPARRRTLSVTLSNYGNVLFRLKKYKEAEEVFRRALGIDQGLAADFADIPEQLQFVPRSLSALATTLTKLRKHQDAVDAFHKALELQRDLVARFPDNTDHRFYLGSVCFNLGGLKLESGEPEVALGFLNQAIAQLETVLAKEPNLIQAKQFLEQTARAKSNALVDLGKSIVHRLRQFEKNKDAAGVRLMAEQWEGLNGGDPDSLYNAACFRAVTAAVLRVANGPDAAKNASAESDRAMEWLRKAVAAGFRDAAHLKKDADLDVLRDRDDFKKLIADLEAKQK